MIALQKTFKPDFGVFSQKSSHFDISSIKVAFQFSSSDPLTLSHQMPLLSAHRNQSTDLHSISIDWFL